MPSSPYHAVTRGISVSVQPQHLPDETDRDEHRYAWSYTIEIKNSGTETVQLLSRHWRITDGRGKVEVVRGPGVVGERPTLRPGAVYRYSSGCVLTTPSGIMAGSYRMQSELGETFDVEIPAFSLDIADGARSLH